MFRWFKRSKNRRFLTDPASLPPNEVSGAVTHMLLANNAMDSEAYSRDMPKARQLFRVAPILQSFETNGRAFTMASLELYEDGSILRWYNTFESSRSSYRAALGHLTMPEATGTPLLMKLVALAGESEPGFVLRDNLGTVYYTYPSAAGGDLGKWDHTMFSPAVPVAADQLFLDMTPKVIHRTPSSETERPLHTFVIHL